MVLKMRLERIPDISVMVPEMLNTLSTCCIKETFINTESEGSCSISISNKIDKWCQRVRDNFYNKTPHRNTVKITTSIEATDSKSVRKKSRLPLAHLSGNKFLFFIYMGFFIIFSTLLGSVHAKIGFFWHITDLHLDSLYSTKGDVMRSCWRIEHHQVSSSGRSPGRFGDYLCDSPWSLLESATLAMKSRQGDNVEFVLWTGDGLSHSARRFLEPHRLDILRNITELLGRTFPSQFVFPVLGHDDGSNTNFRRLGELWRHWLPSEALQTFEKGGYYTIEQTKSRLRIIALNTNFMRHDPKHSQSQLAAVRQRQPVIGPGGVRVDSAEYNNFYYHHATHHYHGDNNAYGHNERIPGTNVGGQVSALSGYDNADTQKQWDWLEDVLAKSNRNKETVYIVGHIPPGSDERLLGSQQNGHTSFSEKNNLRYLRLVRKYSSIIQGQFFGHLHSDSFRIIYNDMGKPVSWIMISPSVTPRKMNVGSNNPAMRLYKFDTDSGQVLDYTQYYLDLDSANAVGEANWQPEYNLTTHYYGLSDVSAVSLHNLADRFTNNENPLFGKYYRANSVRYLTQQCEGVCALNHYCAITRVDYREFRQCLETAASALASNSPPSSTPSIVILMLTSFLLSFSTLRKHLMLRIIECIQTNLHTVMYMSYKLLNLSMEESQKVLSKFLHNINFVHKLYPSYTTNNCTLNITHKTSEQTENIVLSKLFTNLLTFILYTVLNNNICNYTDKNTITYNYNTNDNVVESLDESTVNTKACSMFCQICSVFTLASVKNVTIRYIMNVINSSITINYLKYLIKITIIPRAVCELLKYGTKYFSILKCW